MRAWLLSLLLAWQRLDGGEAQESAACPSSVQNVSWNNTPKVVFNSQGPSVWSVEASDEGLRIAVTPLNETMDPDLQLYGIMSGSCRLMLTAQDYGGDFMVVPRWAPKRLNISQFFVHVSCRKPGCAYHVSFRHGDTSADGPMPISLGETKSSLAYHGEPLEYVLECGEECRGESENGIIQRLTISAWPRDATSRGHLSLLVRKDKPPSTSKKGHLKAYRGWFSGEVVSTPSSRGKWFITVLKKHGRTPLPFLLSVTLPKTLQELPLGKPTFGASSVDTVAFYRFEVTQPDTDIEVYMTVLSGDADIAMSHSSVNPQPTPLAAQWKSRTVGDDELIVKASDPKRKATPTGWFHVGVHGYQDSVFSIIALAEPTSEGSKEAGTTSIVWTELWLGLPQMRSISAGRTGRFLFYNQLVTPRLYVNLEEARQGVGKKPDLCMAACAPDVHYCPYMSPLPGEREAGASSAVSTCSAAKILAGQGGSEAIVTKPCTNCWYSILATTQEPQSHFRLVLGADGSAHPLVAGEAFLGNVDVNDSSVELVFDLTPQVAETRQRAGAVLRAVLTAVYGDPGFKVVKDDQILFQSNESERSYFEVTLSTETNITSVTGAYYFEVWAASMHSQFRLQVFWENAVGANALPTAGSLLGLPKLPDGKVVRGATEGDRADVYLFQPGGSKDATISVTTLGKEPCQLAATVVTAGEEGQPVLNRLLERPAKKASSLHLELGHSLTYGLAQTMCTSSAMRLCYGGEVCHDEHLEGGPVGKAMEGDHWVPIKDDTNDWIQVGANPYTCWTHNGKIWPGLLNAAGYGYPQWGLTEEELPYKNHVFCCEMTEPYWLIASAVVQSRRYKCYAGRGKDKPMSVVMGNAAQNPAGKDYCETACNQEAECMGYDYELKRKDANVLRCRLYTYTENVADSENEEHQFCKLEDVHGLPLDGMVAWFKSSNSGISWQSSVSEHVGKFTSGFVTEVDESGHGSAGAVKSIKGTKTSLFDFGEVIYDNFTVCSVSRYAGSAHGRVITGGSDWFHGHWQDSVGVARYGEWATNHHEDGTYDKDKKASEDWKVICGTNAMQSVYVNGWNVATNVTRSSGRHRLQINVGVPDDEKSDWAVMEVVTWSRPLSPAEMQQTSEYLMRKLQVVYLAHSDKVCKGSYLMENFQAETVEVCGRKCRDIGSFCTGFVRFSGTCSFLSGRVSLEDRRPASNVPAQAQEVCWLPKVQQIGQVAKDEVPRVWRTPAGKQLLNLRSSDPQALNSAGSEFYGYAVAVLPAEGSGHVEYELEAVSADVVAELPATGVPVSGRVSEGSYRRYRVVVLEAGRHLAISLQLVSGDADLYVGLDASVARGHSNISAEVIGSDSIFVPAFGALNKAHCSQEALEKSNGECVYFVAVRGSSAHAEFRLSATIPSGAPVPLMPGSKDRLVLPRGTWQYFFIFLQEPQQAITFQVSVESGAVASINVKVTSLMKAQSPGAELADLRDLADFTGRSFAGVWSARMNAEKLSQLCQPFSDVHHACAAFVAVEAKQSLYGEVTVVADGLPLPPNPTAAPSPAPQAGTPAPSSTTRVTASSTAAPEALTSSTASSTASPTTSLAPPPSPAPAPTILPLEAGVPTRGVLQGIAGRDVLSYAFLAEDISGSTEGLYVVVTPLTECKPILMVDFPQKPGSTQQCEEVFAADAALGYIFAKISRSDACFGPGLYVLKVKVELDSPECQVDVRAQMQTSSMAAFDTLLMDAPLLVSDNRVHFFMFTSRIDSEADAASRDRLTVRITSLAGELFVDASFLRDTGSGTKDERLEDALRRMRPQKPKRRRGALAIFSIHKFHDHCGTSLVCQVLVRVSSVHNGGFVDYQAVATDDVRRRFGAETLILGLPVRSHIGSSASSPGGHLQFQVFLNNPSAEIILRLTCGGDKESMKACQSVILSADARADFPKNLNERRWVVNGHKDGVLEIRVNPYVEQTAETSSGSCRVPCVLYMRVESQPGSTEGRIDFELSASEDFMYKMLLDGNDARMVTAQPSRPEYFLFDSRQRSPLLTFIVTVQYDSDDPFLDLLNMYILDCAENDDSHSHGDETAPPVSSKQLNDPKLRPTREFHRFKGLANTRNQLVAFVSRVSEAPHCYYRIAVISNRLKPVTFSIRGFGWHDGEPLPLGQPLQGMVGPEHKFSYRIETVNLRRWTGKEKSPPTVFLSLEVCRGSLELQTAEQGPADPGTLEAQVERKPTMKHSGGVDLMEVNLRKNRWLQISAKGPENGSYILLAEDPFKRVFLKPTPQNLLSVTKGSGTEVTLEWSPALLFGRGQPSGGAGGDAQPEAEYEVFYIKFGDNIPDLTASFSDNNLSTPCGLYEELRRNKNAKRVIAKTKRRITLSDLDPHAAYVFNVVARSMHSGHSVAYYPYRSYVYDLLPFTKEVAIVNERSTFWDDIMPILIIISSLACVCYTRPCCKAGSSVWSGFEIELPGMSSRGSSRSYQPVQSNFGSYAPPSIVGGSRF